MQLLDKLFTSDEVVDGEKETRWARWQWRTFYALGLIYLLSLIALAIGAPDVLPYAAGAAVGGFAMFALFAYVTTGITRRIRSQLHRKGYEQHFSDRYWATLSYLSVLLAPIVTLATNATATTTSQTTNLLAMYIVIFPLLFLLTLPFYELSKAARIGYNHIANRDATPPQ